MKRIIVIASLLLSNQLFAQDANVLIKEASNLEKTQKEDLAYEKYKQVLSSNPDNIIALIRSSELSSSIGGRQADKKIKKGILRPRCRLC